MAVNPGGGTDGLCQVSAEVVGVSGAGIMLMSTDTYPRGSLCSTNAVSARIEDLQFTLGEGPCVDAYRRDRVVVEADLADPGAPRWVAPGPGPCSVSPTGGGHPPRRSQAVPGPPWPPEATASTPTP